MLHRLTVFRPRSWLHVPLSLLMMVAAAPAESPPAEISARIEQAVLGIISYTRWPQGPISPRLCVVGQPAHADAFFTRPMQLGDGAVTATRRAVQADHFGDECDVVYEGALAPAERLLLRRQLIGHPILTVTDSDPQCSGGSMFCLDMAGAESGGQVLFAVNLDSVARSGVQVNPHVLLLGRRRKSPS